MNWTKIGILGLFTVFVLGIAIPQTTFADCSYNGYYNSKGKCAKSWKEDRDDWREDYYEDRDEVRDRFYENRQLVLERYIEQLMALLERLKEQQGNYTSNDSDVDVITRSAVNIETDEADLRGELDLNSEDEAEVYFEYGTSRYDLDETSSKRTLDDNDDEDFTINIDGLDENTLYYFRAVAEDENGDEDYGAILSFRTDNDNDEEPEAETRSANDVEDDSAVLRGTVDMNDFNNGEVFFVYGEDEDQIDDVDNDFDSFNDVDEDGDDLQKVRVDSDLDGTGSYTRTVTGLDNDTDIFFRICVGYEDEDDDDTLECGDTGEFTTDN